MDFQEICFVFFHCTNQVWSPFQAVVLCALLFNRALVCAATKAVRTREWLWIGLRASMVPALLWRIAAHSAHCRLLPSILSTIGWFRIKTALSSFTLNSPADQIVQFSMRSDIDRWIYRADHEPYNPKLQKCQLQVQFWSFIWMPLLPYYVAIVFSERWLLALLLIDGDNCSISLSSPHLLGERLSIHYTVQRGLWYIIHYP